MQQYKFSDRGVITLQSVSNSGGPPCKYILMCFIILTNLEKKIKIFKSFIKG